MFDPNKAVRTRSGLKAQIVYQGQTYQDNGFKNPPIMALVWIYPSNELPHIMFYDKMGRSTSGTAWDLINFDTPSCANHLHAVLSTQVYVAIKTLWRNDRKDAALDGAIKGTTIPRADMEHYLKGLWG